MKAITVLECHNELGEGPIWHPLENRLYWLDILQKKIQRYDPRTGEYQVININHLVSALGLRGTNTFITAGEDGFAFWDSDRDTFHPIGHPEKGKPNARFNDGKVDRDGRFWAGTMTTHDTSSTLYRLDENLMITPIIHNVTISNGIGWSPDDCVMYHADTLKHTIFAYDFDHENGTISHKRELVRFSGQEGNPDGLTVDANGCVWCALWGGWRVECYSPEGKFLEKVEVPVQQPSSCAFGGDDFTTLYITSAREGLSTEQLADQPQAGNLFQCQPGVCGLPEPKFAG